jgi:hypothetical protein
MRDYRDAKAMATSLRQALADKSVTLTHSESLELIAKAFGLDNWNVLAAKIEAQKPPALAPAETGPVSQTLYCSFCGKSQHAVAKLIAGPSVFICDQCVGLCDGILLDQKIGQDIADARARWPDAPPLEAAALALKVYADDQLEASRKGCADWLEHIEWSLGQIAAALNGKAATPWRSDETALRRGWTRDPLAGKSRDEIIRQQVNLQGQRAQVSESLRLVEAVLKARGLGGGEQAGV